MNITGKLIGAFLGLMITRSFAGVLIGLFLGHLYDTGVAARRGGGAPAAFLNPLFAFAGAVSKSDGRVSESEIAAAEALMARMKLDPEQRRAAVDSFNRGKHGEFQVDAAISELRAWSGGRRDLGFLLMDLLLDILHAEGPLAVEKLALIRRLCDSIGFSEQDLAALSALKGYAWPGQRSSSGPRRTQSATVDAYSVLGLDRSASDSEIKTAWRRLMSQHHPDKLGNVPDELKRRAEARARDINAAYEQIKSQRGLAGKSS
ncbi:MAG: co-chaperone DjlA [Dokdonella sp.]